MSRWHLGEVLPTRRRPRASRLSRHRQDASAPGVAVILPSHLGMAGVDPADTGAASGLLNTAHQIGGSIGLALLTVVFAASAPRRTA